MGRSATHQLLQIRERQQSDETHGIGTHHAEAGELVLLVVISRHHTQQRTVGYIDSRVDGHHEQIERVGIDPLTHRTEVGGVQQQREDESEGYRTEDEPRTIRSPTTLGTVGQRSHQRVGHHIEHTCHEHQRSRISHGQTEHIGEEQRESNRHHLPRNTSGSRIT